MNIPNLSNGPPSCGGRKACPEKGWIYAFGRFLCSDCLSAAQRYRKDLVEKQNEEMFNGED